MNGLSAGALAKITSFAQPKPSCDRVRSAASRSTYPSARIASMLMPAAVVPTFTEAQAQIRRRKNLGKRLDQPATPLGPAFLDECREPADEVDAHLGRHVVERAGHGEETLGRVAGGHAGDRADGDPPVHDRDAVPSLDLQANLA